MTKKYSMLAILTATLIFGDRFTNAEATNKARSTLSLPAQEMQDLALDVKPTKSVYLKNEPIEIEISLRNDSSRPQIVARHLGLGMRIRLVIIDQSGNRAKPCGRIPDEIFVLRDNYETLSPGKSVHARLAVTCDDPKGSGHAGYVLNHSGTFLIDATYSLPIPKEDYQRVFPNADVIRGPIRAKPVTIELR